MQSTRVSQVERVGTIIGSNQFSIDLQSYAQPGLIESLPWVAPIANSFEEYRFVKLIYHYRNAVSTLTDGIVLMSFDYDALDQPPLSARDLSQSSHYLDTAPWNSARLVVNKTSAWKYTRDRVIPNTDLKTYDLGRFFVASEGTPADKLLGYIECEYVIEFRKRQSSVLNNVVLANGLIAAFNINFQPHGPMRIGVGEVAGPRYPLAKVGSDSPASEVYNSLPHQLLVMETLSEPVFEYANTIGLPTGVYTFTLLITADTGVVGLPPRSYANVTGAGGAYRQSTMMQPYISSDSAAVQTWVYTITRFVAPAVDFPELPENWGIFYIAIFDTGITDNIDVTRGQFTVVRRHDAVPETNSTSIYIPTLPAEEKKETPPSAMTRAAPMPIVKDLPVEARTTPPSPTPSISGRDEFVRLRRSEL